MRVNSSLSSTNGNSTGGDAVLVSHTFPARFLEEFVARLFDAVHGERHGPWLCEDGRVFDSSFVVEGVRI